MAVDICAPGIENIGIFSLLDQPQGLWWGYLFYGVFDARRAAG
jgi:hypothetical protein